MSQSPSAGTTRYARLKLSQFNITILRMRNPFVQMWWSAALPGFGHLMLGKYMQGFILVGWEFYANVKSNLNAGIYYSLIGDFDAVRQVISMHWLMLYISVYIFSIWDVYARTIDLNKVTLLAIRENHPIQPMTVGSLGVHGLRPVKLWLGVALTLFLPGLGQLYMQRLITGIFAIGWWFISCYYSHFQMAVYYTLLGDPGAARKIVDMEWMLFMPSLYCFALYDSISSTVTINRIYETELAEHLKRTQQNESFQMPR